MNLLTLDSKSMAQMLSKTAVEAPHGCFTIRPARPDDVGQILRMHQRLSPDSLSKRYHRPRQPDRKEIEEVCALEGRNGRVLVVVQAQLQPDIVGMAYFVRTDQESAETAFLVEDRFQGQGLGRRLMAHLVKLAVAGGIRYFDALVLPSNRRMIYLLHLAGPLVHNQPVYGAREIRVQLNGLTYGGHGRRQGKDCCQH